MKTLFYAFLIGAFFTSCVEPDPADNVQTGKKSRGKRLGVAVTKGAVANKNFLQINNTYSKLTGIAPDRGIIEDEYAAIMMQLPSSTNPETMNGFNQIASTRLAFAYCNHYIDDNEADYDFGDNSLNSSELKAMTLKFVDMDFDDNPEHASFLSHLQAIMSDEDGLVNDGNAARKKRKLLKMSCAAVLSSTYVTLF